MRPIITAIVLSLIAAATPMQLGASDSSVQDTVRLPREWAHVHPGGETGCAFDTPFRFFHRKGQDPSRLLVYFEGGGACWEWVSCSGMFDTNVAMDELSGFRGIFDFANAENGARRPWYLGSVSTVDPPAGRT